MKVFVATATFVSLIPSILGLTIDSPPSVVQCQPSQITWHDGTAPYYLTILPGGQPSAPPLKSFAPSNSLSVTWVVDIGAPTPITLAIKDGTGAQAYSSIININTSSDSSCINPNVTISGSTGSAAATTAGNTSPGSAATTTTAGGSSSSSSTSASASSTSNAGSRSSVAALGLAGMMGLVGAVLF